MALKNDPVFVQTPKVGLVQIVNADGTAKKNIIPTAGADGSKVVAICVATDDTASHVLQLFITNGGTNYLLGSASVPAGSGNDGVAASVDLLRGGTSNQTGRALPIDNDGQTYLFLRSADTLTCSVTVAMTAAKTMHVMAVYADF